MGNRRSKSGNKNISNKFSLKRPGVFQEYVSTAGASTYLDKQKNIEETLDYLSKIAKRIKSEKIENEESSAINKPTNEGTKVAKDTSIVDYRTYDQAVKINKLNLERTGDLKESLHFKLPKSSNAIKNSANKNAMANSIKGSDKSGEINYTHNSSASETSKSRDYYANKLKSLIIELQQVDLSIFDLPNHTSNSQELETKPLSNSNNSQVATNIDDLLYHKYIMKGRRIDDEQDVIVAVCLRPYIHNNKHMTEQDLLDLLDSL